MVIFHSYVSLPEGNRLQNIDLDGKFRGRLAQDLWDLRLIFGMPRSWWTIQLLREKFTVGQYEDFHHFSPHNAGTRSMTWRYLGSGNLQWAHVALGSAIPTGIRIPGIPLVRIWVPSSHRVRSMGPVRGIITLAGKSPILMELKLVFGRQAVHSFSGLPTRVHKMNGGMNFSMKWGWGYPNA